MRIAYILRAEFGLLGTNASYMFPTIAKEKRHEVLVLSNPTHDSEKNTIAFFNNELDIYKLEGAGVEERVNEAMLLLDEFRPNVVHQFYFKDAFSFIRGKRKLRNKTKCLLDIRTPLLTNNKNKKRLTQCRNVLNQFYVDHITSPVDDTIKSTIPFCVRPSSKLPIGVNMDHIPPFIDDVKGAPKRFVFVGSLAPRRKLTLLLHAFCSFVKKMDRPMQLDLIGSGAAVPQLQNIINNNNLHESVFIRGLITQDELFTILPSYDAGLAYIPEESFSRSPALKVLEYAAAGLPILASDLPANRAFADEGFSLSMVANTKDSWCQALMDISKQPPSLEERRENRCLVENYDWRNIFETYLEPVYVRLAHGK